MPHGYSLAIRVPGEHIPYGQYPTIVDTWKQMEQLLDTGAYGPLTPPFVHITRLRAAAVSTTGKVKSIGVSNFSIKTFTELLANCTIVPATNQVEVHPCLPSFELQQFCQEKGILLTAYSPLGPCSPWSLSPRTY